MIVIFQVAGIYYVAFELITNTLHASNRTHTWIHQTCQSTVSQPETLTPLLQKENLFLEVLTRPDLKEEPLEYHGSDAVPLCHQNRLQVGPPS